MPQTRKHRSTARTQPRAAGHGPRSRRHIPGIVVTILAAVALVGGFVLPSPARADDVATAQARVDRLQSLVTQTTAKLLVGTQRWEADQRALRRVRLSLRNTQSHVQDAENTASLAVSQVSAIARRLYMTPTPAALEMAFTKRPGEVIGALQAQGALNQVAGTDGQIVLRAQTSRLRLQQQERVSRQLAAQAQALVDRSAARLKALDALAESTATQLVAAQSSLQRARSQKAARKARATANERAARSRSLFTDGPACTGRSTSGQQNGNLDPASLCPLWRAPGQRLRGDAATAFDALSRYRAATVGSPLCVSDSYRSYSEQVALYRNKPGLAAVPGTSEHGWGKAVDFCGGIENTGSGAYNWMKANAGRFGWFHPTWAEPSGNKPEPWHWEFSS